MKAFERAQSAREDMGEDYHPREFSKFWPDFLSAHKIYSKLEQGAKSSSHSGAWFGAKRHERRNDPLLSYVHHARNVDEHGLANIAAPGLKFGEPQFERVANIGPSSNGITVWGETVPLFPIFADAGQGLLHTVTDRGVAYRPPQEHLGAVIPAPTPMAVADLALAYLEDMVREAAQLPET